MYFYKLCQRILIAKTKENEGKLSWKKTDLNMRIVQHKLKK